MLHEYIHVHVNISHTCDMYTSHKHITHVYIHTCRLMRRRIKVAAYMHIREEVVDEYHYEHTAVRNVPGIRVVLDC